MFVEPFAGRAADRARDELRGRRAATRRASAGTTTRRRARSSRGEVFAEAVAPPPRLVAVGAGDIAEALCALAKPLGWHTVVVDPRAGLATRERVPSADELLVAWPDEVEVDADTALVSLVHEERLDIPALSAPSRAAPSTSARSARAGRRRSGASSSATSLDQVRGPVGLDLGGETPAEVALEILAEMLAVRKNRVEQLVG